jgi:hypothetical protein
MKNMKLDTPKEKKMPKAGTFNAFTLAALSFTWAHFLGLISPWFIPLTILLFLVGYGSEIDSDNYK